MNKSFLLCFMSQQRQKAGYEATSAGSNRQTVLQGHLKNIFFWEKEPKERKRKQREHTADLPSRGQWQDSFLIYNQEAFRCFTCASCPPTHNRPLSACLLSAATPQLPFADCGSRILHIMWWLTHFVIVSACVWASVRACVIWLRVPGWCGQSAYFGSLI